MCRALLRKGATYVYTYVYCCTGTRILQPLAVLRTARLAPGSMYMY